MRLKKSARRRNARGATRQAARSYYHGFAKARLFARRGGEGGAFERLNVFAVVGGDQASIANPWQSRRFISQP